MTVYYRGPKVLITDRTLEIRGAPALRFAITELSNVHIVLGVWRLRGREYQLRGSYHGYLVELFSCRDARVFGQVRRGLLRALEAQVKV